MSGRAMGHLFGSSHGVMATREYEKQSAEEEWPKGWPYSPTRTRLSRNEQARSARGCTDAIAPSARLAARGGEWSDTRAARLLAEQADDAEARAAAEAARRHAARLEALRAAEEAAERPMPTRTPRRGGAHAAAQEEYQRWREQLEEQALRELVAEEEARLAAYLARKEAERRAALERAGGSALRWLHDCLHGPATRARSPAGPTAGAHRLPHHEHGHCLQACALM